jgi:hypothetical protein
LCKLLLSAKSGECLVVVEGLHVELALLLLASVVASSVSTLSVSTSSITASVISSVVVITIIVEVGSTSSVGATLESQIFGIDDELVGFSFLTTEFSGFLFVDFLAFDDFAFQDVVAVVSFSGSFWCGIIRWSSKTGHVLFESELNFDWFFWLSVLGVFFGFFGWVFVFSVVVSNGLWSWFFGSFIWVFSSVTGVEFASASSFFTLSARSVASSWVATLSIVAPSSVVSSGWSVVSFVELTLVFSVFTVFVFIVILKSLASSWLLVASWLPSGSIVSSIVFFLIGLLTGDGSFGFLGGGCFSGFFGCGFVLLSLFGVLDGVNFSLLDHGEWILVDSLVLGTTGITSRIESETVGGSHRVFVCTGHGLRKKTEHGSVFAKVFL